MKPVETDLLPHFPQQETAAAWQTSSRKTRMQQFDVKRGSRKCCVSEQPFGPGDIFYSALIETSAGTVRSDFSVDAWKASVWHKSAPENSPESADLGDGQLIGWWKQRAPDLESGKVYWAPDQVLIAWFEALKPGHADSTNQQRETAWVTALLLLQKKLLTRIDGDPESDALYLVNKKTGVEYRLQEPDLHPDQIEAIQQQLAENLFSDRPIDPDDT